MVANLPLPAGSFKLEFIVARSIICGVYFGHRDLLAACSLYLLKSLRTSPIAFSIALE